MNINLGYICGHTSLGGSGKVSSGMYINVILKTS